MSQFSLKTVIESENVMTVSINNGITGKTVTGTISAKDGIICIDMGEVMQASIPLGQDATIHELGPDIVMHLVAGMAARAGLKIDDIKVEAICKICDAKKLH